MAALWPRLRQLPGDASAESLRAQTAVLLFSRTPTRAKPGSSSSNSPRRSFVCDFPKRRCRGIGGDQRGFSADSYFHGRLDRRNWACLRCLKEWYWYLLRQDLGGFIKSEWGSLFGPNTQIVMFFQLASLNFVIQIWKTSSLCSINYASQR